MNEGLSPDLDFTSQRCWIPPGCNLNSHWGYWGTTLRTPVLNGTTYHNNLPVGHLLKGTPHTFFKYSLTRSHFCSFDGHFTNCSATWRDWIWMPSIIAWRKFCKNLFWRGNNKLKARNIVLLCCCSCCTLRSRVFGVLPHGSLSNTRNLGLVSLALDCCLLQHQRTSDFYVRGSHKPNQSNINRIACPTKCDEPAWIRYRSKRCHQMEKSAMRDVKR